MLTGIRWCVKSIIINQIIDEIKNLSVKDDHIIYINFEDFEYEDVKEAKEFNQLVKNNIIDEAEPHTRLVHVYDLYSIGFIESKS